MVDLSAGMLLIRCRNEACRALAACAPAAESNCSDVKRCICRCIHACRCMHAGSAGKLVCSNRKCGALRFPAAIDTPRRITDSNRKRIRHPAERILRD